MNMERLKEIIHFYNPWWSTKEVPQELLPDYERPVLADILSYLDLNRVVVLKGPRRTGKTTLLYQIAADLLKKGVNPENILFLSLDTIAELEPLDDVVNAYQQLARKVLHPATRTYFLLDEVQFLKDWPLLIKKYFDRKLGITFVVSGSAASLIRKGSESLAGRTVEETILPFTFFEYLSYHERDSRLQGLIAEMRNTWSFHALPGKDDLVPYGTTIHIRFDDYLAQGGFPHLLQTKEKTMRQRLLREDVIEKAIYRDLVELYQIKKPAALEKLFLYLCEHSSELLNISNIAASLGLSREYTERYLDYLEAAFLIFRYGKYAKSVEEQVRSMEKCYVTDPGLLQLAFRPDAGKAVESMAARHLMARKAFYWRDERHEVDLVLDEKEGVMPIEVKYQGNIGISDTKGLVKFLNTFKEKSGIMVTKDLLEEKYIQGMTIRHIPAWLFLLMADK